MKLSSLLILLLGSQQFKIVFPNLNTYVSFIDMRGNIELLHISATQVSNARARLELDGFSFQKSSITETIVLEIITACLSNLFASLNSNESQCIQSWLAANGNRSSELLRTIEEETSAQMERVENISCSKDRWLLFARSDDTVQNMHYDEVLRDDLFRFRVWVPLGTILQAPLVLSTTLHLYENESERFAVSLLPFEPTTLIDKMSAGKRIFSRDEFIDDCSHIRSESNSIPRRLGTCAWFHTLGMKPGEMIAFQNSAILHGTASVGSGGNRVAIAVDCHGSNALI